MSTDMQNDNALTPKTFADDEETGKQATRLAYGVVVSMTLRSAIELGAIDAIYDGGSGTYFSVSEIAERLPCRSSNPMLPVLLDRLLRLLASFSILKYRTSGDQRTYAAGPVGRFFVKDEGSGSIGPLLSFIHEKYSIDSWYHLNDAILEGGIAFHPAHGMSPNEFYARNPTISRKFNVAMTSHTVLTMRKVLEVYDGFRGINVLVDVGGGIGTALSLIVAKYPGIRGINFDLPHVVADAPSYPGMEHVGGDMFVSVPKAAAVFMKWILHAWNDEECVKLLKNCRDALPSGGKVIVMGAILADEPEKNLSSNAVPEIDMFLMVRWLGGRERTMKEIQGIAVKAGFSYSRLACSAYDCWVLELHKH